MMYPFIIDMVETDGCLFYLSMSAPPSERHLLSDLLSTLSLKNAMLWRFYLRIALTLNPWHARL